MRYCSFVQISEVIDSHAMMGVHVELNTLIMIVMIVTVHCTCSLWESHDSSWAI